MSEFKFATRGNANPQGKPRVYFTCHPDDFARYFDKICEDILKTQDCAIYYTEDMTADLTDENSLVDLERMNLFVIPITFRLLNQPNRAMDSDFRFANDKHIPVLPIMMESGIDAFYASPNKFGELQYINPFSHDLSEISYEEKLKKYLESVLISNEVAQKVRNAFDAYIFLSYRKKDRKYANELMRLIHSNPECRDIAVWYDEFLTPGESFKDNIDKMLSRSDLFTLLVTPSLLEMPDGKPNFVMSTEYPAARDAGKDILPAEMVKTEKSQLCESFEGIPECVDAHNDAEFKKRLLDSVKRLALTGNDNKPEHNFLIGLAYLDGIDVEVDRDRALELITGAAEAELPEAMRKLVCMYHDGTGVKQDYREALKWQKRLTNYFIREYGINSPDTLTEIHNLAYSYDQNGDYQKSVELNEKAFKLGRIVLGKRHPRTLMTLNNLAASFSQLGDYEKALKYFVKVHKIHCKVLGKKHPDTLISMSNLAITYGKLGNRKKALEIEENVYLLRCEALGEEHPDTIDSLSNLAITFDELGIHEKALELTEKVYKLRCRVLGEEHPDTIMALADLALIYGKSGDYSKTLELNDKVYKLRCKVLGKEHPYTLTTLSNLAVTYMYLDNHEKALELNKKAYELRRKVLGAEHSDTIMTMSNLAATYMKLRAYQKAIDLNENMYHLQRRLLGEEHLDTVQTLENLACAYVKSGECEKANELLKKVYKLRKKILGEKHPKTLNTLYNLAMTFEQLNNPERTIEICDQIAQIDELDADTINNVASTYKRLGFEEKAALLRSRLS